MYFSVSEAELDKYVFQIRIVHVGVGAGSSPSDGSRKKKHVCIMDPLSVTEIHDHSSNPLANPSFGRGAL